MKQKKTEACKATEERFIKRSSEISLHSDRPCCALKRGRWQGVADRELVDRVGLQGLTVHLEETMNQGKVLKNGSKSFVSCVMLGGIDVVIKGYRHLGLLHSLRHALRGSRAKRSWGMADRLYRLGVPTPKPLAYLDEYRGVLLWRSFFIYEYVPGPGLSAVLSDPAIKGERKRRLIDQVVEMLRRLSEGGISHGDLKHSNMICHGEDIFFIDLDAMRRNVGPGFVKRYRYERDKARFFRDIRDS